MGRWEPDNLDIQLTATALATPLVDKVLDETLTLAKRRVPVRQSRQFDHRPTGRLKKSLRKEGPRKLKTRVAGRVGSGLRYAASVHQGAEAHPIVARRKPLLVFHWEKKGITFAGKTVNHPGIRRSSRTQYLYLPLVLVGRRHGFIVRQTSSGIASGLSGI